MLSFFELFGLLMFSGSMALACIMDLREQMVYRFVWLIGGVGGVLLLLEMGGGNVTELGVFLLLQQCLFSQFYGRADCHAYCVCAMVLCAFGMSMQDYLIHMLITFAILTFVQLVRGNILRTGRLREPVPLIPYITAAFALWVDFSAEKWYI